MSDFRRDYSAPPPYHAYNRRVATWRADSFDDWDDVEPSRSVVTANTDEIVEQAESEMGDAVRLEFIPFSPPRRSSV